MKIGIFGASASAQTINHKTKEVTGYCEVLRREHMGKLGATQIAQFVYAGSRLSDGGVVRVRDVVKAKPDICIVEPLVEDASRGREATRAEVEYVYAELIKAGIRPVALMLPLPLIAPSPKGSRRYVLHQDICKAFRIPFIEVDVSNVPERDKKFVGVHTLHSGARIYAEHIVKGLLDMRFLPAPVVRKTTDLHVRSVECVSPQKARRMTMEIHSDKAARVRVVQKQKIGPFSPVLKVSARMGDEVKTEERSLWDPYCHFERESYVVLFDGEVKAGRTILNAYCSDICPPHDTGRKELPLWPSPAEKYMKLIGDLTFISDVAVRGVSVA